MLKQDGTFVVYVVQEQRNANAAWISFTSMDDTRYFPSVGSTYRSLGIYAVDTEQEARDGLEQFKTTGRSKGKRYRIAQLTLTQSTVSIEEDKPKYDNSKVPPFKVDDNNALRVVDSLDNQVVTFPAGSEDQVIAYVDFLNGER